MAKTTRRQAGDGALYQRADGMWVGSIELGWTTEGRRRRKTVSSRTQKGALTKLREVRRQLGLYGDVPTSTLTVGEWLDRWLAEIVAPEVRPRTLDTYRHKVNLAKKSIGKVRLDKLNPAHVRAMREHITGTLALSPTTAQHVHGVLHKAMTDAVREGLVVRNVVTLVKRPRAAKSTRTGLTAAQARSLLTSLDGDPYAARWAMALLYGQRQGEVLGLEWDRVDFNAGTIDISWQLQRLTYRHGCARREPADGWPCGRTRGTDCPRRHLGTAPDFEVRPLRGPLVLTRPKTRRSIKLLPMLDVMDAALRHHREHAPANGYGLVFTTPTGEPIERQTDTAAWAALLAARDLPTVVLHEARHTTATLLLESGVPEPVAQEILGHTSANTLRGYQHVSLDQRRAALEGVSRMLTD